MKIKLAPTVYSDLLQIMEHYDSEAGSDVAAEFYAEFRNRAKAAAQRPYSFPLSGNLRRVNLKTFPHHFVFEIVAQDTVRFLLSGTTVDVPTMG